MRLLKQGLTPVDNFPEVPLENVEASGWKDVALRTIAIYR